MQIIIKVKVSCYFKNEGLALSLMKKCEKVIELYDQAKALSPIESFVQIINEIILIIWIRIFILNKILISK